MKEVLVYEAVKEEYGIEDISKTMTVGELISFLENYDDDTPVYLSFNHGYIYGGIVKRRFEEQEVEDED